MTGSCSLGMLDHLRRWQLESLVRELACVPPSAGICYLCTLHGIFLLAPATDGRICYLGTLNSICLFSFHSASATVGRICYLGTLNSICLFSFHSASATIGRICYLGTPSGIRLFSFHFASATIDRITVSRHVRQQLPLWNLNLLCTNLLALHRRPEYVILARSTESAPYASTLHRPPSTGYAIQACSTASASLACILHIVSATVDRITPSEHTQQHLPL